MSWSWSSWYVYIFFTISTSFAISAWWSQHNKAVTSRVIPIIEEGVEPDVLQHLLGKVQSMKSYGYPTDPAGIAQKDSISTISTPCSTCPLNQFSAKKIKEIRLGFNCQGSVALRRSAGSLRIALIEESPHLSIAKGGANRHAERPNGSQWIPMAQRWHNDAQCVTIRHKLHRVHRGVLALSAHLLRQWWRLLRMESQPAASIANQNYPNSLKWVVWQFNTIHANCPEFISIIKYSCLSQTNLFSHQPLSSPTVVVCHRPVKDQSSPVLPSDAYPFLHRSWVLRTRLSQIFTESWTNLLQKCNENKQTMANQWRTTTIWAAFKPLKSPPRHIGGAHFLATNWCNDLYWFVTFCDESTKIHTFHRLFTDAIATRERVWSTRRDCDVFWRRQENTQTTRH